MKRSDSAHHGLRRARGARALRADCRGCPTVTADRNFAQELDRYWTVGGSRTRLLKGRKAPDPRPFTTIPPSAITATRPGSRKRKNERASSCRPSGSRKEGQRRLFPSLAMPGEAADPTSRFADPGGV